MSHEYGPINALLENSKENTRHGGKDKRPDAYECSSNGSGLKIMGVYECKETAENLWLIIFYKDGFKCRSSLNFARI